MTLVTSSFGREVRFEIEEGIGANSGSSEPERRIKVGDAICSPPLLIVTRRSRAFLLMGGLLLFAAAFLTRLSTILKMDEGECGPVGFLYWSLKGRLGGYNM